MRTACLAELGLIGSLWGASVGDGKFFATATDSIVSQDPTTGEPLATVRSASSADYKKVISASLQAFHTWCRVPAPRRGEIIRQIGEAFRKYKTVLGTLISLEMGKSLQEGLGEVQEVIDMADFVVGLSRQLYGLTMHSERPYHRMYEQWHPLGPVGVITAFNFPMAVWAWNALLAAVCGNTVIWKPSLKTPLCAIAVQRLVEMIMVQNGHPGVFSLFIPKEHSLTDAFVADHRIPLISFTGSTEVGRHIHTVVAARLGKSLLELGGNNAIIVDATADLKVAIPAIVFGSVGTTGQRCTTTRRLFVEASCFDTVLEQLIYAYRQVRIGDPLDQAIHMGPLIDEAAVVRFEEACAAALREGAVLRFGGKRLPRAGYFVEPTIFEVKDPIPMMQQETFAPILYVTSVSGISEAIVLQNSVAHGLSSALFTLNMRHAEQFLSVQGSDCGIANINIGTSGAEIGGAFGGEKDTGGGREAGSDAWKAYMRRQTNTINWGTTLPLAQGIQFIL